VIVIRKDEVFNKTLMNKLRKEYEGSKRKDSVTHVSDILPPPTCIRRAWYGRQFPDENEITIDSVNHFLRGQASEYAITKLNAAGVAQLDVTFGETVKGHPDIAGKDVIYELKDTTSLNRLDFNDHQFRSYLRQLLYYMVMTNKDRGIISIKYNAPELKFQRRTAEGELYLKPWGSRMGVQAWDVYLALDDPIRDQIKEEILQREKLFQEGLKTKKVDNLPRLPTEFVKSKCTYCSYKKRCDKDPESQSAKELRESTDLLDLEGIVNFDVTEAPNVI